MENQKDKQVFQKLYNVSRETILKLEIYHKLLLNFQRNHNIIGSGSVNKIWVRHFADSAKIFYYLEEQIISKKLSLCDVGTGAGFPGMVVKILMDNKGCQNKMTLIESNRKKCSFLQNLKDTLNLNCEIINDRAENIKKKYNFIMCRAVSPLKTLLPIIKRISKKNSLFIIHKGKNWANEVNEIKKIWQLNINVVKNNEELDYSGGVTLEIKDLSLK